MSIWFWKLCWTHWREKNKKTRIEWEPAAHYTEFCHQLINSAPTQSSGSRKNTSFPNCKQWSISKMQWLTQCRELCLSCKKMLRDRQPKTLPLLFLLHVELSHHLPSFHRHKQKSVAEISSVACMSGGKKEEKCCGQMVCACWADNLRSFQESIVLTSYWWKRNS